MGGKSSDVTVSTYYLGAHLVICHGIIDAVTRILVDNRTAWTGNVPGGGFIEVDAPDLFGGQTREGGITGRVDVLDGNATQDVNPYLASKQTNPPNYRGVVSLILNRVYVGLNYYYKPWAIEAVKIHTQCDGSAQWQDALAEPVADNINAVHVVRECLVNKVWGLGVATSDIDETTFLAAANTCFTEGLGFSWYWNKDNGSIFDFIADVLSHIQGNLYRDRITNKYKLTLNRKIAGTTSLPVLYGANVREVNDLHRTSIGDLTNQITIKYEDIALNKENSVTRTNPALAQRQGDIYSKTVTYSGVTSNVVANRLAIRDLQMVSNAVYTCTIKASSYAATLNKGDAFRLQWPKALDNEIIMRVLSLDLGTPSNSEVTISAIQDVFNAPTINYTSQGSSEWVDPINAPINVTNAIFIEIPYYFVAISKGDSYAQDFSTLNSGFICTGVSPTSDSISAQLWTTASSSYTRHGIMNFCSYGTLLTAINKTDETIILSSITDRELLGVNTLLLLGDEFVLLTGTSPTSNILNIKRGMLDTIPETHAIGEPVYNIGNFYSSDQVVYAIGESVSVKLLTSTPLGVLPIGSATVFTAAPSQGRMHKPYPPANVMFSSKHLEVTFDENYPTEFNDYDVTITWAHRNRLLQTTNQASLINWYDDSVTVEPGVTYSVSVEKAIDSSVLASATGLTSPTYTYLSFISTGLTVSTYTATSGLATMVFSSAHGFNVGGSIKVDYDPSIAPVMNVFGGYKYIASVPNSTTITFYLPFSTSGDGYDATIVTLKPRYLGDINFKVKAVRGTWQSTQTIHTLTHLQTPVYP